MRPYTDVADIAQLEVQLQCAQQQGDASAAQSEERLRELQTLIQEQAEERVRLVQESTAAEVEDIKDSIEKQRAQWEDETAAARAEIGRGSGED